MPASFPAEPNPDVVASVVKAIDILEFLAAGKAHYALHEIATELDMNKTTTHRLLQTLGSVGWVERSGDGGYGLGYAILPIGLSVQRRIGLREMARPLMEKLVSAHGGASVLLVPAAAGAVCVESVESSGPTKLNIVRVGAVLPFHTSAGPRVLAAHLASVRENIAGSELVGYTSKTITSHEELTARLAEVRDRGYELADSDLIDGIAAVAVPIFDADSRVVATLGFGDTSPNLSAIRQLDLVQEIVAIGHQLSAKLGGPLPAQGAAKGYNL